MSFRITWKTHILTSILAVVFAILLGPKVNHIVNNYFSQSVIFFPTGNTAVNFTLQIFILMIPIIIVHELIHGGVFTLFGGRVKFGFRIIYAYTREISGVQFSRPRFWGILLAPVTVISLFCLFLPLWLGGMVAFLNFLGSAEDIYMAVVLLRYRMKCKIIDRKNGFDIV